MVLNKQIKLYSINLGMVKTEREKQLYRMKYINEGSMFRYRQNMSKWIKEELNATEWTKECNELFKDNLKVDKAYTVMNESSKKITKMIDEEIKVYNKKDMIRTLDSKYFKEDNIIAFFDNVLTRTLGLEKDELTLDFLVIEVKKTDMKIVKQVIEKGIIIKNRKVVGQDENGIDIIEVSNDKYKFFTAGAGQTRQKKFMMIKEELWDKYEHKLMCGLTIDKINKMGGMNTNKFNAYLSLNNSASEVVEGFDIDRCVVVDDFTEVINDTVDYITRDDEFVNGQISYTTKNGKEVKRDRKETKWDITRQKMDVPIDFMDGAGICLESVFKKNTQVRAPWFKGILCPVNYKKYIKENKLNTKITDLWGKEYDVIKDDIRVIFSKSQFKMWKYYKNIDEIGMTGWEVYKACFKAYGCTLNKCLEDEDKLKNMNINYQMLQTLNEMTDEQIDILTKDTKELINKLHSSAKEQLKFLGGTLEKRDRNYLQEIIRLYPEILTSKYMKEQLKQTIKSFKKEAKSGRIKLQAKRVFIIPDLIHFMSLLFGDGTDYALEYGQVSFNIYKDCDRLALLRSPHLSREWGIRKNVFNDKTKYFKTNGIYVSSKDLLSLVLMNDWDGDEALVIKDCEEQKWLLDLAEKQMSDLVPIYYEMGGGDAQEINSENEFKSLKFVYEKSNIGKVSNTLTNIWSKNNCNELGDEIKKLCAYNNWVIDSSKKLELPKLPKNIKQLMNNKNYPYFFQFAKNKEKSKCRPIGNGVIDRICKSIDNIPYTDFDYSKGFGKFNKKYLLKANKKVEIDYNVIDYYKTIVDKTNKLLKSYATKYKQKVNNKEECNFNYKELAYEEARKILLEYANSIESEYSYEELIDIIITYGFEEDEMNLAFIFNVFGAVIINNINNNLNRKHIDKGWKLCEECGERFKIYNIKITTQKYCEKCGKKIKQKQKNEWKKKIK